MPDNQFHQNHKRLIQQTGIPLIFIDSEQN